MLKQICEAFLDEAMELYDLPGLTLGVLRKGETFTGARGVRDVLTGDPLQADDIFHCASVCKTLTSAAVLRLAEAGALRLEDRLCDILPDLGGELLRADERYGDVRLYQILSHTAGIGDMDDYHWEQALTGEDALARYVHSPEVAERPLLWGPGEGGFRYSNIAFEILGHIVSEKSPVLTGGEKLSYEEVVRRFLLEPADMRESTMLTFERLGVKAGEPCPVITDAIRERNAGAEGTAGAEETVDAEGTAGPERTVGAERTAGPEGTDGPEGTAGPEETAGSGSAGGWHPMALPHEKAEDRRIVPVRYYPYTRNHSPSSTLTSNVQDMLKYAEAHIRGFRAADGMDTACGDADAVSKVAGDASAGAAAAGSTEGLLLQPDTYRKIRTEYAEISNNREKMGLGWFMRRQDGYQLYGHEGSDDGFRSSFWICPQEETAIVILCNLSGAPVKKLNKKLFSLLMEDGVTGSDA